MDEGSAKTMPPEGAASAEPREPRALKRFLRRLASSREELEAEELKKSTDEEGATPISCCEERKRACVAGTLRTVTLRPRGGAPALEAELYDGSDVVNLVWLGRRRIVGIEPGRRLRAE